MSETFIGKEKVIELLKEDSHYYGVLGKKFLSNSDIGILLNNPLEFGIPRQDNAAFAKGRVFHYALIEPYKVDSVDFVDVSSRNTNKYRDALKTHEKAFLLLHKEVEEMKILASAMKNNESFASKIYEMGNEYEVPAIKNIFGLDWKGKTDILSKDFVYDLKSTSSIKDFKWNAKKYNYDSQAYIYRELFDKPMVFLVAEKGTNRLAEFPCAKSFYESGREKVLKAVDQYNKFFGDNPTDDINSWFHKEELF